ncbi:hypothetical protein [Hymenobacter koreensis]
MSTTRFFCYAALLLLTQCSKCKDNDPSPEKQLPPATQTGANTFGCLVNGQAWTPRGNNGTSNYSVVYEQTPNALFDLRTYRYFDTGQPDAFQYLILFARNLRGAGVYDLADASNTRVSLNDRLSGCYYNSQDAGTYHKGTLTITRLDLQAGIIAGTFDFTLYLPGCDTLKVTNGRFDKKL